MGALPTVLQASGWWISKMVRTLRCSVLTESSVLCQTPLRKTHCPFQKGLLKIPQFLTISILNNKILWSKDLLQRFSLAVLLTRESCGATLLQVLQLILLSKLFPLNLSAMICYNISFSSKTDFRCCCLHNPLVTHCPAETYLSPASGQETRLGAGSENC